MVESFFNKELSDVAFEVEALDEWKSLATELGFEAQLSLAKGKESPIPYPFINEVMNRVYSTLCPRMVDFKKYNKSTIPLEIMKQIAYSVREKHFQKIEIWYDDKTPDPIVVGEHGVYAIREKGTWSDGKADFETKELAEEAMARMENSDKLEVHYRKIADYLIGRWGDELLDFPSLKKRAIEVFVENEAGELKKEIATKTEKLKLINENAASYMNGNMQKYEVLGRSW
jgi:hypothetical protein